ncbi:MAG: NADH-quinone oxidoreductase subunit J [Francisellaceae bacterium]|jgi:NADH-quinone oxidoreductase subunit J|nr:NADH-quinone oxidoreductase subunit J [Francisellaceae bacterium]MBT6207292.1 NADH-quinone oxidoreductase subunit J [Francisellaceae bacterium]MBT6539601.1 NADH-quinone oxidoreductase subunit J [Francisellaceae bacterium]
MVEKYFLMLIAAVAIVSAVKVIVAKNTVHSAFALILTFFSTAIIWLSLAAEFLAITLVLVYVGAVLVLFLFVVMMLEEEKVVAKAVNNNKYPLLISLLLLAVMVSVFSIYQDAKINPLPLNYLNENNIKILGKILFSEYLIEFEIVGIILLVGMISAIGLTYQDNIRRRTQVVDEQVQATASSRIRMLKLDGSEKLIEDK